MRAGGEARWYGREMSVVRLLGSVGLIACLLASIPACVARAQDETSAGPASRDEQRARVRCAKKILQEEFVTQPRATQLHRLGWLTWKTLVEAGSTVWAERRPPGRQSELLDRFTYPLIYKGERPLAGDLILSAVLRPQGTALIGKPGIAVLQEPYTGPPHRVRATVWSLGNHKRDRQFLLAVPGRMPGYERCWFADEFYSNPVPARACFNEDRPEDALILSSEDVLEELRRASAEGDTEHIVFREGLAILRPIPQRWNCP